MSPLVQTVSASIFDVTFGLTGRLLTGDITLKTEPFGLAKIKAEDDFAAVLPMGHLGVRVRPLEWLAFEGGAEGMGWDGPVLVGFLRSGPPVPLDREFLFSGSATGIPAWTWTT